MCDLTLPTIRNGRIIISKYLRKQKQKEDKNNETKRDRGKWRNCQQKCFHSFKYVIDQTNVRYLF